MKLTKRSLILVLLGLGLVLGNITYAQTTADQGTQTATQQRNQNRDQVKDPAASGGQQQKQQLVLTSPQ